MIDIFIAGAQKAVTTSLLQYLNQHRDIQIHPQKEMTYFFNDEEFQLGESYLSSHYKLKDEHIGLNLAKHATMSISDKALGRLQKHNPECKVIFLLGIQ